MIILLTTPSGCGLLESENMASLSNIQSTAGAIPVRNEKGEFRMEKVKVTRYMPGRRPDYAPDTLDTSSSSSDSEGEGQVGVVRDRRDELHEQHREYDEREVSKDRRLERLRERATHVDRSRRIIEPEVIEAAAPVSDEGEEEEREKERWGERRHLSVDSDEESDEGDSQDQEAIDRRRELMKEKARERREEELMDVLEEEEDGKGIESDESSEYEDYTDSEDDMGPRLKPVFVRKSDRVTLKDNAELAEEQQRIERERKIATEKRKKYSTKLVAEVIAQELQKEQKVDTVDEVINTDDENEEEQYEAWKVRELQRIKRDREEIENRQKDKDDLERLRNMSEEERLSWLKMNPKQITNQQEKGKYKFLQKYYHRGVFYLDEEDEVLSRNFAQPTLEDHFDKTVLPKVMQVKDFGRAGRTKYTHLVDQDTTAFDSPWTQTTPINVKIQNRGGGMKDSFEKPSAKRTKTS